MRHVAKFLHGWFQRLTVQAKTVVVILCLVVLGVGVREIAPIVLSPASCMNKGATNVVHDGPKNECIGITDGAYSFAPSLTSVERRIQQENQLIRERHPTSYVSVVLLLPISSSSGSIMTMTNALEQFRGAYTAQYRANRANVEGDTPYIQLLVGSDGYQGNQEATAARIIKEAGPSRHIAAVAGLGLSLATTKRVIQTLTAQQISAFGATLTSDAFDNIKGFVRISPDNKDETAAALSYVKSKYKRAVLVEDENSDDIYNTTLVAGFQKFSDKTHTIVAKETFDTSNRNHASSVEEEKRAEEAVRNRISLMHTDICDAEPDPTDKHTSAAVVLFAGRGNDLAELVGSLSQACLDKQVTIISGDDVTNLPFSPAVRQSLADPRHVGVYYSGVANPGQWPAQPAPPNTVAAQGQRGFKTFNDVFQQLFQEADASLSDGNTMAAYDATLAAVSAIRLTNQAQPTPEVVAGELGALQGAHTVLGSSGPLRFIADYRTSSAGSNPVGKVIPILRLNTNGESTFVTLK